MAAVAMIDVESGRIEALAGALSPCTREEYDGPGRSAHCDKRLPYPIRYRPDALLNAAVFHDAMPGSTIKPIMAAAFLSDPAVGARWLRRGARRARPRSPTAIPSADSLRGQLMRSNSARFLDRMFCADKGFAPCARPWEIQAMAPAFGWNGGCAAPSDECGKRDLLFGRALRCARRRRRRPAAGARRSLRSAAGRTARRKARRAVRLRPATHSTRRRVQQCAAGPDGQRMSKDDWEKCSGGVVVDVVAEGWGQGQARASALGVAGMMAMLAAAANGQTEVREPHLVAGRARRGRRPIVPLSALEPCRRGAESHRARRRGGDHQRPFVQPSRGNGAAGVRAGVRCAHLRADGLDRGQDRHADVSQRRSFARRPCAVVRAGAPSDRGATATRADRCGRTNGTSLLTGPIPTIRAGTR